MTSIYAMDPKITYLYFVRSPRGLMVALFQFLIAVLVYPVMLPCVEVDSRSLASFRRVNASKMVFHASRSMRSSCKPCPALDVDEPSTDDGKPTPSDGGIKPGGGALMAEGAIRDFRMWASDDRTAMCMF